MPDRLPVEEVRLVDAAGVGVPAVGGFDRLVGDFPRGLLAAGCVRPPGRAVDPGRGGRRDEGMSPILPSRATDLAEHAPRGALSLPPSR